MTPYAGFLFFTFSTLKTSVLRQPRGADAEDPRQPALWKGWPELSHRPYHRVLLFSVSSPSYPLDVARRRMQLGVVLPESDKCRTLTKTLEYVYSQYGVKKGLYRGLSLNYICCVPSQAVAFFTYELMKQTLHLN